MTGSGSGSQSPVGMLVGGGELPLEIARSLRQSGRSVHVVAIDGEADQDWSDFTCTPVNWGAIGGILAALKGAGCRELVIVGRVRRPDMLKIRPDLGLFLALARVLQLITAGGDDSLLRRCLRFFEDHGLTVRGPGELAPELLAPLGAIGRHVPDEADETDIALGFAAVRALGRFDIGQGVVAKAGQLIAVEGAEGTDRLIGRLRQSSGAILVKCPKPGQELRIDMPAIGPRTVEMAVDRGLRGIAVEAGNVLVAGRGDVSRAADKAGIFVAGAKPAEDGHGLIALDEKLDRLGQRSCGASAARDARLAAQVIAVLRRFSERAAVLVVRHHVLAVGIGESVPAFLARTRNLGQWGDRGWWRRGALAVSCGPQIDRSGIDAAAAMRLAAIVIGEAPRKADGAILATHCDRLRVALLAGSREESRLHDQDR